MIAGISCFRHDDTVSFYVTGYEAAFARYRPAKGGIVLLLHQVAPRIGQLAHQVNGFQQVHAVARLLLLCQQFVQAAAIDVFHRNE